MALVNHAKREINAKIVFCGPAAAGKATLLKAICSKLPADNRGPLRSMGLQQDRMLFFDFTHPQGGDADSYSIRFHVYTLTGAVNQEHSWKMVLKGADGLAFVADSAPGRQAANRQIFDQVRAALHSYGKDLNDIAAVVLCAKRDLADALPLEQMRTGLDADSLSLHPVSVTVGEGVLEGLGEIISGILANLEELGLVLQPTVRELQKLGPIRVSAERPLSSLQPATPEGMPPVGGKGITPEAPMISFIGAPEVGPDGTLRVHLQVDCCDRKSTVLLRISLQDQID